MYKVLVSVMAPDLKDPVGKEPKSNTSNKIKGAIRQNMVSMIVPVIHLSRIAEHLQ